MIDGQQALPGPILGDTKDADQKHQHRRDDKNELPGKILHDKLTLLLLHFVGLGNGHNRGPGDLEFQVVGRNPQN